MPDHLTILHTNDFHGALDDRRFSALRGVRDGVDLYFDTGDAIKTGNLGIPLKPEAVWPYLDKLDCTASVPGNRESHVLLSAFEAKIGGHRHPILCANLYNKDGQRLLASSLELEIKGLRVGVFGLMVPMVTERMKSKMMSQMLWTSPIAEGVAMANELRGRCDLVIALTHIGLKQDQALAAATGNIDLILGGHSHSVIETPMRVGRTWICQGGSHGRFYGRYEWSLAGGVKGGLRAL
jgi:5'-nucleotidase